jgi:hypothetical protein
LLGTFLLRRRRMSRESQNWHDTYRATELVARRASSHERKIERLGIFELSCDACVLNLAARVKRSTSCATPGSAVSTVSMSRSATSRA